MKKRIKRISEVQSAKDALKHSEEKYRMLLDLAVDAFFQGDSNGDFITVNDKAVELTGYSKKELLKMNMRELFPKETLSGFPLNYDLLLSGITIKAEREIIRNDGERLLVEMHSKAMPDGTFQSLFRNITESRMAELAALDTELKYRNLHMSMMDGYVFVDMAGKITDSNRAYQQMLGYEASELATLTYDEFTPAQWHDYEHSIVREQILPKGHSAVYQKEYIRKDGTVFPVELRTFLVRNASGENEGMWAIVRDITERKKAEEALRKSEEKFRNIVESSPTAMYFYHLDGENQLVLTGANPASDKIIGISHQLLIGKTIEEAFPNLANTEIPEVYRKVARNELGPQTFEIEYTDERFSGFYFVHTFRTSPLEVTVEFVDITSRRQTEELNRRNTEQKEILLREIHHRVKNNLAIVISLLNFQLNNTRNEELIRIIVDIQMRIRSMALIHEHLYRSENLDRIPLATYIESLTYMITTAFSGHRVELIKHLEPLDVSIETALPIGLIINELLTNAFKYAFPDGAKGNVRIILEKQENEMCSLVVADNGIGLPASFSMDSEKSLGLYIVRLLVEQLDGTVNIVRNQGTSFQIRFRNLMLKKHDGFPNE